MKTWVRSWQTPLRWAKASRAVVANGQWFGTAGPYEKIAGTVYFELDPADPRNRAITDIDLAPKNARGMVEYVGTFSLMITLFSSRASVLLFAMASAPRRSFAAWLGTKPVIVITSGSNVTMTGRGVPSALVG